MERIVGFSKKFDTPLDVSSLINDLKEFAKEKRVLGKGRIVVNARSGEYSFYFEKIVKNEIKSVRFLEVENPLGDVKIFPFRNLGLEKNEEIVLVEKSTGNVLEGNFTNIFVFKDEKIYTHPADGKILNGICRQKFIKLMTLTGISVVENYFDKEFMQRGKIILTNSVRGVICFS